ncbi:hypothetical protein NA78x_005662 [Anatilimnocola sp. NA78]|uniref:hypothetical protein n=1 Tax=Anatilimnocola sp. NA78 TaxID=3415683 RepID=UPI003CE5289B
MNFMLRRLLCLMILLCGCAPGPTLAPDDSPAVARDTTPPLVIFESDEYLIADATLRCILTSAETSSAVKFYGTSEANELCLQSGEALWPSPAFPATTGYKVHLGRVPLADDGTNQFRVLGLRLEELSIETKSESLIPTAVVRVAIFNAGGSSNGGVIGGCNASLKVNKSDAGWTAEVVELFDP